MAGVVSASITVYMLSPVGAHWFNFVAIAVAATLPISVRLLCRFAKRQLVTWKTRRFRFSTRSLLVGTTLAGIGMGLLGHHAMRARKHRARIKAVHMLGARIGYDLHAASQGLFFTSSGRKYPQWARKILGDPTFGSVVSIDLSGTSISDADLVCLAGLPKLSELNLSNTNITGDGLVYLEGTKLVSLALGGTRVNDDALAHLEGQTLLHLLDLGQTDVTDRGLVYLNGMRVLESLRLNETKVSDEGLKHLERCTNLDFVDLENTDVTRAGLLRLRKQSRGGMVVEHDFSRTPLMVGVSSFGRCVAIGDKVAVVGDPATGIAHLFDITTRETLQVVWPNRTAGLSPRFASSVAIDGGVVVVGAPTDDAGGRAHGAVYVFDVTTGKQLHKLVPNSSDEELFGDYVAVHSTTAVIRGRSGVYVYDLSSGKQQRRLPTGPDRSTSTASSPWWAVGRRASWRWFSM